MVIFQNKDDKEEIISKNKNLPHLIITGSGVDLLKFKFVEEVVTQIPRITMISRLLVHKGVLEFVEDERLIKEQNIKTGHNKEKIDQISASLILRQFLSSYDKNEII